MTTVIHLRDSPFVGGPEKQILGQCIRMDASRYKPMVASFTSGKPNAFLQEALALGMCTAELTDGKLFAVSAAGKLNEMVCNAGDCVVICSGFKADLTAVLAGVPWIGWFHGHTGVSARVKLYEALDFIALRRAGCVMAVCERAADDLRSIGLQNVLVVPNAVDVEDIADFGTQRSARADLCIGAGPVVGTVSRLSPEKGVEYFIDAMPAILKKCPDAQFLIIGDGPLKSKLRQKADSMGVLDFVTFTGHKPDAVRLAKAMDIFVLPSLKENMPVALLEAMACGVSVVATDVGGVGEVLRGTGIAPIRPSSPDSIASAVILLLNNNSLRMKISNASIARMRDFEFIRQVRCVEGAISQLEVQCVNKHNGLYP